MKIDGDTADPRAVAAWKVSLAAAAPKVILDFVAVTPSLQAGFRPGKMSHKVALDRVQAMLEHTGEIPKTLRELLAVVGLGSSLVEVLSEDAICVAESYLRDYFGSDSLYSAMLLSDREGVRALGGAGFLQEHPSQVTPEEKQAAGVALAELFQPFLTVLGSLNMTDAVVAATSAAMGHGNTGEQDKKYSQAVIELTEKSRELKRLTREIAQTKSELDQSLAQNASLVGNLQTAQASLAAEQVAHQRLAQAFEQQVADEVQRRVDARVLPWLEPAEALAATVAASGSTSLMVRAEALLSRQEESDRRYGLWSELARERDDCLAMIDRLNMAKRESIQPLPELAATTQLLMGRVAEIEKTLGRNAASSTGESLPSALSVQIQAAANLDELAALRMALEGSSRLGLLHEEALSGAYRLIEEGCWKLYSTQPEGGAVEKDLELQRSFPLHALQRSISQGMGCLLLIDGHNVLFRLRGVLQLEFEENIPGPRARRQLTEYVSELSRRNRNLDIHLWFDGEDAQDLSLADNLIVHYSGGTGSDRADRQIVKYLDSTNYMNAKLKSQMKVLVTADSRFAEEARSKGAVILAPEELAILVTSPAA